MPNDKKQAVNQVRDATRSLQFQRSLPMANARSQSNNAAQLRRPPQPPGRPNNMAKPFGPNQNAARPSPANSRASTYALQVPISLPGRSQQIRATISGTQNVAGSIEISHGGGGQAYISNLRVEQQHRRRGVAAKLIDAAVSAARRQGFNSASLEARPSDNGISPQALVAMYRRQGFKNVGKSDRGSPMMERKLR